MTDSCIISKDQLSSKEQNLKSRLYGGNITKSPQKPHNQRTQNTQNQGYQSEVRKPSPQKLVEHHKTQLKQVTDQKMDTFIDEMRQQFFSTQNANAIPHSILYQQTRSMDKQVQLLEQNQKAMGDIINNLMNADGTGPNTAATLKQQIFNDSRRMLLDMMIPFNQQLNDMRLMYENNKSISRELGDKIDELKRTFSMQSGAMGMTGMSGYTQGFNPFQQNMMVATGDQQLMDPSIMKKALEDIKDSMRDVQKEAVMIEQDMEKRRKEMLIKEQTAKYLPQTLTEEFSNYKQQLATGDLQKHIESSYTVNKTREAVYHRLGGQFDYTQFMEDLRQLGSEKENIDREFKTQQLWVPDFKGEKDFGKITYDFSTKPLVDVEKMQAQEGKKKAVSHTKPMHYQSIVTQPKYIIDESFRIPEQHQPPTPQKQDSILMSNQESKPLGTFLTAQGNQTQKSQVQDRSAQQKPSQQSRGQQQQQRPTSSTRQHITQKPVHDYVQKRVEIDESLDYSQKFDQERPGPTSFYDQRTHLDNKNNIKKSLENMDILTLKKQVIEEIKNELELNKGLQFAPKDPYRDDAQKYKDQKDFNSLRIQGGKDKEAQEEDLQNQIMTEIQKSRIQAELAQSKADPLRQSMQSVSSNQPLTESMVLNTVADVILKELNKDQVSQSQNLGNSQVLEEKDIQKYGEQVLIDKIQSVLNEIAVEYPAAESQESNYISGSRRNVRPLMSNRDALSASVQVLEQSLLGDQEKYQSRKQVRIEDPIHVQAQQTYQQQPQPIIVPVVVNQGQPTTSQSQDFSRNPNQLRDMITQAISAQLQLHNIKKDNISEDPLNQTTRTMQEEEARNKLEQQLLRKQIPINVHPYIAQTINQGPARIYQNPFIVGPGASSTQNIFGIQPPLLNDLDQFNLDTSSSDFLSMNSSQYSNQYFQTQGRSKSKPRGQKRYSNITLSEKSDGEVGKDSDVDESLGEIKVPGGEEQKKQSPPRHHPAQFRQTMNYEEEKIPDDVVEKPIYESTEGPIPKGAKRKQRIQGQNKKPYQPTGKSGQNILNSADSFGMNPLKSGKGGMMESKNFPARQKLEDNFLEEEDDYQSSKLSESGEIDPKALL